MSADARLVGVRAKIERAKQHIFDLDAAYRSFNDTHPYRIGTKVDPNTRQRIDYIESIDDVPTSIPLMAGDAIHNLRSALDHLAQQLFLVGPARTSGLDEQIYFPIVKDPAKFKPGFHGKVQVFGPDAIKAICALEPYKGGKGHDLWVLHKLNNTDKHRLLITVGSGFHSLLAPSVRFAGGKLFFKAAGELCPLKAGDELCVFSDDVEVGKEVQFNFRISFNEPGIIEGKPIVPTLHQLAQLVDGIVNQFVPFL